MIWKSVLVCVTCIALLFSTACLSQQTIAELVTTLGNAASAVAAVEGDSALSAKLRNDTAAASSAVLNWKTGTAAQNAVEALNLVEDDLYLFPVGSQYQPLIILAVVTADSIISIISSKAAASRVQVSTRKSVRAVKNAPMNSSQFKKQWNAIVAEDSAFANLKL